MDVSVVIPLYNKVNHIQRTLDSVLAQTFKDFEIVVVNDGSTDGSNKVVERCADPRVRLLNQENAGVSAARNRGIDEARADLTAFLDADDEWLPEFLETILRLYGKFPGCGAYATAYDVVSPNGGRRPHRFRGIPPPPWEGVIPNYFRSDPIWTSVVAIPRRVFDSVGHFRLRAHLGEDSDMWCRIALKYPLSFSTRTCAVKHQEAENRACLLAPIPRWREYPTGRTIAGALESGYLPPGVTRADVVEYLNERLVWLASRCVIAGDRPMAREYLLKAATTRSHRRPWLYWWLRAYLPAPMGVIADGALRLVSYARGLRSSTPQRRVRGNHASTGGVARDHDEMIGV